MKFSLASLALLLSMGTAAYAADVPPIVAPYPNHVVLGEASDTLTSPSMNNRQVHPEFAAPADHTLFKEIVPCRLTDSRGGAYTLTPHTEWVYGLGDPVWDPDCYGKIPTSGVVALTIQVTSYNDGKEDGYFTFIPPQHLGFVPQLHSTLQNATAFLFYENGNKTVVQAGTVTIGYDYLLHLWNEGGTTEVTIDILGYHLNDPLAGTGATGSKGETGATGATGKDGAACTVAMAIADPSATHYFTMTCNGVAVATWNSGTNGTNGTSCVVTGAGPWSMKCGSTVVATWNNGQNGSACDPSNPLCKGPKGDTGATGATGSGTPGAKGDKGDQGIQGIQGICPTNCPGSPWNCSNACGATLGVGTITGGVKPLWDTCAVLLTGPNPIEFHYVGDGTPKVYNFYCGKAPAWSCPSTYVTIDKGSTYCYLSLPDPSQ